MKFKIASKFVTGVPDPSGWVQVHDFTPVSEETFVSKGRLFAVISMTSDSNSLPKGQETIVGREVLTRLHEDYFNQKGEPLKLLTTAVEKIHKDFSTPNESLQILVAIVLGEIILFSGIGEVEGWVIRSDKLAKIIDSGSVVTTASGSIKTGDSFVLGTSSYFEKITPELLRTSPSPENLIPSPESTVGIVSIKLDQIIENNIAVTQSSIPVSTAPVRQIPKGISPVRIKAASLIDRVLTLLPNPNQKGYIKDELGNPENNKKKKIATTAGIILLALLFISILFGKKQQSVLDSKSKYEPVLSSAEHNLEEAEGLTSLNSSRARDLILTAKSQIDGLKSQKISDSRISDLSNKIDEDLGNIAGIYLGAPASYLDLGLISSGFKGDDIAASDERMVILDRAGKRLVSIDIGTSKTDPVAGPDIMPNAVLIAAYSDRNFVSADNGIWEVGDKAEVAIKPDWTNNILISAYTGNFYVLDKNNSAVWRYQGDGGAFGTKQNWFGDGIKPDLSAVVSWTIDGNIWMLTSDNQILRFSGGSPIDFSLKDLDKSLKATDIFTTQDSKYIYILDNGNNRVLVVDKDGNYKAQYIDDSIKNAKKIVVSETDKKIILLGGDKLYSLDIKHL